MNVHKHCFEFVNKKGEDGANVLWQVKGRGYPTLDQGMAGINRSPSRYEMKMILIEL